MSRKLVHVALTAASRQDLVGAWTRLGFTLDSGGAGVTLADGDRLDFLARVDAAQTSVAAGLSGAPGEKLPAIADAAASCFQLAAVAPVARARAPAHPNGALGLRSVVALADEPADHGEFLSALTGQREMRTTSAGLELRLDNASLDVLSPRAFAFHFGVTPPASDFAIAGLVFAVADLAKTEAILRANKIASMFQVGRLSAGVVEGVAVAFERV